MEACGVAEALKSLTLTARDRAGALYAWVAMWGESALVD